MDKSPDLARVLLRAETAKARHDAWLKLPSVRRARAASRTAYRGLGRRAALALAKQDFPHQLKKGSRHLLRLRAGERVVRYLDNHVARIKNRTTGRTELAVSVLPLRAKEHGRRSKRTKGAKRKAARAKAADSTSKPIDLGLHDDGADFVPANPIVPITIPKALGDEVSLGGPSGIRFRIAGNENSHGSLSEDKVFYPSIAAGTDALLSVVPTGLEAFFQLRSSDSPQDERLDFTLPAGAGLSKKADGSIAIVKGNATVGEIERPVATDAQGQDVPVSMSLDGRAVKLHVATDKGSFAYPILVDPVLDNWAVCPDGTYTCGWNNGNADFSGWTTLNGCPSACTLLTNFFGGNGLWIGTVKDAPMSQYQNAQWQFAAWGATTYITRAEFGWSSYALASGNCGCDFLPWMIVGLQNGARSAWTGDTFVPVGASNVYYTVLPAFGAAPSKYAAFQVAAPQTGTVVNSIESVRGAVIYEDDPEPPTIDGSPGHAYDTSRWLGNVRDYLTVKAHDPGLGVYRSVVSATGNPDQPVDPYDANGDSLSDYYPGCLGPAQARCNPSETLTPSYSYNNLAEGIDNLTLYVEDPTGKYTQTSWTAKVDNTLPSVSGVGGSLYLPLSGPPPQTRDKVSVLPEGTYDLHASAIDANASHLTSGLTSLSLKVDGSAFACWNWSADPTGTCSQTGPGGDSTCNSSAGTGSCSSRTVSGSVDTSRYGAGIHTVSIEAVDGAGNRATQSWRVRFAPSDTSNVGPGTLDLSSGNFQVTRDDVSIPNFGSSLTFSRTFNSRDPGAKIDGGILGPGWVASLPVDDAGSDYTSLEDTTDDANPDGTTGDGSVNVTESDGSLDTFTPNGSGGYTSPPGLEELTLQKSGSGSTASYALSDTLGDKTIFENQPGDKASVFKPDQIQQPGSSTTGQNTTKLGYEPNGHGGTRVFAIFAPPPPGPNPVKSKSTNDLSSEPTATRELIFNYATNTTASSDSPTGWGDYQGQLQSIDFKVQNVAGPTPVAQYQYDAEGRLRAEWDPRIASSNDCSGPCQPLKETYDYDSGNTNGDNRHLISVSPPGGQPWTMSYFDSGDGNPGRLKSVSRQDPALGQTATTTIAYGVPVSGSAAPYDMSANAVGGWGQTQPPSSATAIFPPDQVPSSNPPSDYSHATINYLDSLGREVNIASPGGHISTQEYDCPAASVLATSCHDNIVDTLTPANRERVLAGAAASSLETINKYSSDGVDLIDTLGPQHSTGLNTYTPGSLIGSTYSGAVQGRVHTVYSYDEGVSTQLPNGKLPDGTAPPFHLLTTKKVSLEYQSTESAPRITTYSYNGTSSDGVSNSGWILRQPTQVVTDPGGLHLTTTTVYDSATGNVMETRTPASPNGGDAHATKTIYYGVHASDTRCQSHPEWTNLPCITQPAAQPGTTGLPNLPVTGPIEYNSLDEPTKTPETVGSDTRTTTLAYDLAGRKISSAISSTVGQPLPEVDTAYDAGTGLPSTTTTNDGTTTQTISRAYDTLGRLVRYTDADGNTSTTSYDIDGRAKHLTDGKGSQDLTYDSVTGQLTRLDDSAAGTFTAAYDADGNMTSESLPNGLQLQLTYDETDQLTERKYVKGSATWLDFAGVRNTVGEFVHMTGSLSSQDYIYDFAGRLVIARDKPQGAGCTTRMYSYDADSNRLSEGTYAPTSSGGCAPLASGSHTTNAHSYDSADRLVDATVAYDSFGRMKTIPGPDAGGQPLNLQYYTNDMTASMGQNGVTVNFQLDPLGRDRSIQNVTSGVGEIDHFSGDSDSPSWTQDSGDPLHFTRNIEGIDGDVVAIQDSNSGIQYQLENLHGDIVATAPNDPNATAPTKTFETDEFGVPRSSGGITQRYGYLGSKRRSAYLPTGVIQMGERAYVPEIGRFTTLDPVQGGSANAYDYANQDPVNQLDLTGTAPTPPFNRLCTAGSGRPRRNPRKGAGPYLVQTVAQNRCDNRVTYQTQVDFGGIHYVEHIYTVKQQSLHACLQELGSDGVWHSLTCGHNQKNGPGTISVNLKYHCVSGQTYRTEYFGSVDFERDGLGLYEDSSKVQHSRTTQPAC